MELKEKYLNKENPPTNLPNFLAYYKAQSILFSEQEYETFQQYLLKDLPISFRLNSLQ